MKKLLKVLTTLTLSAALLLSVSACGGSSSESVGSYAATESAAVEESYEDSYADGDYVYDESYDYSDDYSDEASAEDSSSSDSGTTVYDTTSAKLIRTADISLESTDFDADCASIESLTASLGGYMQNDSLSTYGSSRYRSFTVRIPAEQYDAFMKAVGSSDTCTLYSKNESTEDITRDYNDAQNHLTTLNTKLARLQELLAQAEDVEDMITIEDSISDTEYEINSYSSTISNYDDLVSFSTIYISVDEVTVLAPVDDSFGARAISAFLSGLESFGSGLQDLCLFVVGNLLQLIVFAAIVAVIILLIRRSRKRRGDKPKKEKKSRRGRKLPEPETTVEPSAVSSPADSEKD